MLMTAADVMYSPDVALANQAFALLSQACQATTHPAHSELARALVQSWRQACRQPLAPRVDAELIAYVYDLASKDDRGRMQVRQVLDFVITAASGPSAEWTTLLHWLWQATGDLARHEVQQAQRRLHEATLRPQNCR
jgi:hypothetical protein